MDDDAGRFPVSDYPAALRRLWTVSSPGDWLDADESELPAEAVSICDVFGIKRAQLLRDLREDWNLTLAGSRPGQLWGPLTCL